jgi:predicted nuclease with RNAse H fold
MGVLTVGVDLAAEPVRTALATVAWNSGTAVITQLIRGADDEVILAALADADKAGIDCPLGWPAAFVTFLTDHQAGHVAIPGGLTGQQWRRQLAWRVTDEVVREQTGLIPLSVAADRIGHAAMRCAGLLAKLASRGQPVDRGGAGAVVEVYPAASLKCWGLAYRGYKQPRNTQALRALMDDLQAAAPWLDPGHHQGLCQSSHDAIDAVVAALTARAAATGQATRPDDTQEAAARSEGWITLPTSPLTELA